MDTIENIALESAAGSGKTRALTRQFLRLYLDEAGYQLRTLYGITFTNEATLEMKNRILRYLDLLVTGVPRDESEQGILDYFRRLFPDIGERASRKKRYLLTNLSDLNISTFHSLFASFLSSIPFAAGVLPDYEIVDENQGRLIFDRVLDRFLATVHKNERLLAAVENLTTDAETSIKSLLTDTYKQALPWFGFLTDLIDREPEIKTSVQILGREFQGELLQLAQFIEEHEYAGRTKSTGTINKNLAGYVAKLQAYLSDPDLETISSILKADFTGTNYIKEFMNNLGTSADEFIALISRLRQSKQAYFNALSNQKIAAYLTPILEIHRRFEEEKQKKNVLSFADIESYALRAFKRDLEPDYLYFKIGAEISHLLIDEFQDTSYLQLEILNPIITEITAVSPKEKSLFYVGDPRQAIFRWRGGSAELFTLLTERHPGKIKKDNLSKNYRSREEIIAFVNTIIGSTDQARPDNTGGWVRIENTGTVSDIETARQSAIARTASLVKTLHADYGYRYSDIAVLVRRNDFGAAIGYELARQSIPCVSKSQADILSSDDVRLIIQLLKFLDDPENDFALLHLLLSPVFNLEPETLRHLKGRSKTIYLALRKNHPDWHVTKKLKALLDLVYFSNPYELLYRIYQELGLKMSYPLATLLDAAADYARQGFSSLSAFIDWLETTGTAIEIKESLPEGVEVLTVHKAKGLEFEVVILAETFYDPARGENPKFLFSYTEDQVRPDKIYWRQFGKYDANLVEAEQKRVKNDELNLLYVAMTRAKSGLYILGCSKEEPVGFWYKVISQKVGGEYAAGDLKENPPLVEERPEKTYGPLTETVPIVKDESARAEDSLQMERILQGDGSLVPERTIYTPTEREVEILEPARRKGMEFGDLVHKAFERLEWLAAGKPGDTEKFGGADPNAAAAAIIAFIKDQHTRIPEDTIAIDKKLAPLLIETLSDPDLRFIFYKDGKDKKCKNELPLYFEDEKRDVSTHLDRVIIEPEKIIIIDYKTGSEKPEYKQQMRVYKKGIEIIYPGKPVEAILIYLEAERGKKVVTV